MVPQETMALKVLVTPKIVMLAFTSVLLQAINTAKLIFHIGKRHNSTNIFATIETP